jgi:hypothetical protein
MIRKRVLLKVSCALLFLAVTTISGLYFCQPSKANTNTLTVTSLSDDPDPPRQTLREAINNASSGDVINFDQSLNGGTILLNTKRGTLLVNRSLTIDASNLANGITVDGNRARGGRFSVFHTTASTTVNMNKLKVTGGNAPVIGGGISTDYTTPANSATLNLSDCVIQGNHCDAQGDGGGGGGLALGGNFSLTRTSIVDNDCSTIGGGICGIALSATGLSGSITDCDISNNRANFGGGCFTHENNIEFTHCTLSNNRSNSGGGAIAESDATNSVYRDCFFRDNAADVTGGGTGGAAIYYSFATTAGRMALNSCTFENNSSIGDGTSIAIYNTNNLQFNADHCQFLHCHGGGTAIKAYATHSNQLTFEDCNFDENDDGAINVVSSVAQPTQVLFRNCNLTHNAYQRTEGVCIEGLDAFITLDHCKVNNNKAGIDSFGGRIVVQSCTIANNSDTQGGGTGIRLTSTDNHPGSLLVDSSTISGNHTGRSFAGGIWLEDRTDAVIRNSTISGNSADSGRAGGIVMFEPDPSTTHPNRLRLHACTVTNNMDSGASTGSGGIYVRPNPNCILEASSCIIAGNGQPTQASPDFNGPVIDRGYNLVGISDGSGDWDLSDPNLIGNLENPVDPNLGPLADNGGTTQTHALLTGSPAIGAGDPALTGTVSQNGVTRGIVDIGAYQTEAGGSPGASNNKQVHYGRVEMRE